jgi:glyoxylase-like metal-dependent hydrolase (beta-lactamase superfamily II)/rhodanese-related sulfurtransferase
MNFEIDVETLRAWLTEQRSVTVLDVRTQEDRAEWWIPGSVHVNAYQALREGRAEALASFQAPTDVPVITVCGIGGTSRTAAEQLRARGIASLSLAGGMKAWSLAWNTAPVPLARSQARVIQVRRTGKGCLSYIIASESSALVLDASLPPEVYVRLAGEQGWVIRYVLDTHIHADHLSRSTALAQKTGARQLLPANGRLRFVFQPVGDRDVVEIGRAQLRAIRTAGHTTESTCYLLDGDALFTGDTLFLSGVGRPDLRADEQQARERARLLQGSLKRIFALGPDVLVLPGHTSEPAAFNAAPLVARLAEVAERLKDWRISETEFVERILARIPLTPPNYLRIVECNESGSLPEMDPTDMEAGANRCAVA